MEATKAPLKSIEDVADEQAHKAAALVAQADSLAAKSGRSRQEELRDLMMARLTDAAITRKRKEAAVSAHKLDIEQLETFIGANRHTTDPQRIMLNLITFTDRLKGELTSLQQAPV